VKQIIVSVYKESVLLSSSCNYDITVKLILKSIIRDEETLLFCVFYVLIYSVDVPCHFIIMYKVITDGFYSTKKQLR